MQKPKSQAAAIAPGEVRIDGKNVFINNGPVSLFPKPPVPYVPRNLSAQTAAHPRRRQAKGGFRRTPPKPVGKRGQSLRVPFIKQAQKGYCGRASQAMVVKFWTQQDIGQQGLNPTIINNSLKKYNGADFAAQHHYVGAELSSSDSNALDNVAKSVTQGNPAIVYTNYYHNPGHIFVLTGYDPDVNPEQGGQFYINDTFPHDDKYGNRIDAVDATYTKRGEPITMQSLLSHLHSQGAGRNVIYIPPK